MTKQKNIEIELVFKDARENFDIFELVDEDLKILTQVLGDQGRFIQIMQNFLSNAVKFTGQRGNIKVTTSLIEQQERMSYHEKEMLQNVFLENISHVNKDNTINLMLNDQEF